MIPRQLRQMLQFQVIWIHGTSGDAVLSQSRHHDGGDCGRGDCDVYDACDSALYDACGGDLYDGSFWPILLMGTLLRKAQENK